MNKVLNLVVAGGALCVALVASAAASAADFYKAEIAGLRLGMSSEEVISTFEANGWGKPGIYKAPVADGSGEYITMIWGQRNVGDFSSVNVDFSKKPPHHAASIKIAAKHPVLSESEDPFIHAVIEKFGKPDKRVGDSRAWTNDTEAKMWFTNGEASVPRMLMLVDGADRGYQWEQTIIEEKAKAAKPKL
ncbi:MAG: hypothetical protein VR70_03965 [Rhodospirillaceae bacterium BRH_c57]|nr:MAG: hypothetical protein VR70_03965 [Rhodospirillaceae bacterium BRH_c57]